MGEGLGGEWIHVHVWLSPFTVHLKQPQHYESTLLEIKKFKRIQEAQQGWRDIK